MTQKRPKITVTESNREFVIPTLEKLGGVNFFKLDKYIINLGDIVYVNLIGNNITRDRQMVTNKDTFYEVDPKDYVGVNGETSELDQLKAENEKLREKLNKAYNEFTNLNWSDEKIKAIEQIFGK